MNCKKCGAELEENQSVCPDCGQTVKKAPKERKKLTTKQLVLIIAAGVLVLALITGILYFALKPNDVFYKGSYTAAGFWAGLTHDWQVATAGELTLTNGQLQVFYWMQVYEFLNYCTESDLTKLGLDLTVSLSDQYYNKNNGMTWEQYFLRDAIDAWQYYQTLVITAEKTNFQLPTEFTDYFSGLKDSLQKSAEKDGYRSVDEMLQSDLGPGVTFEDYEYYLRAYYVGNFYFQELMKQAEVTDAEMEAYFQENEAALKQNSPSITKESGKLVDIRHILIRPEGGSPSADGKTTVYTDAEWEACRIKAQAIYDEWLAGDKTEDSFGKLANSKSEDQGGMVTNGGLYENVAKGQTVADFENWCFEEGRKTGDHGLIKSTYGYHVMYYVDGEEGWIRYCREGVITQKAEATANALLAEYPLEVKYSAILMGEQDLAKK